MELHPTDAIGDSETTQRRREKAIRLIKQRTFRQHAFYILSKNIGKLHKAALKKVWLIEDKGEVIVEHQDRKSIEDEVIKHNKKLSTQACSTKAHGDKIHHRLTKDEVRDKMLNGALSLEECDEKTFMSSCHS